MSGKLKEVRIRIESVKSTQQITKAMKMVSAAKFRRAQDGILKMRPYSKKLQEVLSNIMSTVEGEISHPLAQIRPVSNVLVVVITSDRGLCGSYNTTIIKTALANAQEKHKDKNITYLPLGKKAYEYFSKRNMSLDSKYWTIFSDLGFENVREVASYIQGLFANKTYDQIELVYSQFVNAVTQNFTIEAYLPIPKIENLDETKKSDFLFEPQKETLILEMMPKILNTQLYKALLDANASEHGARMTAMDKATENAGEILKDLKIMYNQARQASITTELSEIVSGAAALEG